MKNDGKSDAETNGPDAVDELGRPAQAAPWATGRVLIRALRPHQWIKNTLVYLPATMAHDFTAAIWATASIAFTALCLCASAVYVVNDLLDVEADRQHPKKRRRPFASGELAIRWAPPLAMSLLLAAFLTAFFVSIKFVAILLVYLATTTLYSVWLKRKVLVDVFTLAGLYSLRIIAGSVATGIVVSEWLAAFSFFLFASLAFAKRFVELSYLVRDSDASVPRRGYLASDLSLLETFGPTSGYMAVLVLALYVNSESMQAVYFRTWPLQLICPLFMYWVSRVWIHAKRGILADDPILFVFRDWVSLIVGALIAVLWTIASLPPWR